MERRQRSNHDGATGGVDSSGGAASNSSSSSSPTASALPWGMAKKQIQPSSLTSLTDDKLARFVIGQQKKTKFEKEREEREARKRQADEEAAKIYAKFVASFEDEDETLGKAFVRGETVIQGNSQQQQHGSSNEHQRGELYRLKPKAGVFSASTGSSSLEARAFSSTARPGKKLSEMDRMLEEMKQKDTERQLRREQHQAATTGADGGGGGGPPKKKRREIDQFLEELKEREPVAPTLDEMGLGKGSFDHGDPDTTNLYVGNLAPTVTEEALEALFGKYGEIYSVKIMWPRTEEERARRRNCGFVSFYDRRDADEARVGMHDKELEGQAMVVGWGKAVKIDMSARIAARVAAPPPPPVVLASPANDAIGSSMGEATRVKIQIELPADPAVRERVDRLARYVAKDGVQFENAIRLREANNTQEFGFLFESPSQHQQPSALATYYRWRVYAFAMGDEDDSWREAPFQMTVDGPVWVPPKMPFSSRKRRRSRSRSHSRSGSRRTNRSSSTRREKGSRTRSYSDSSSSSRSSSRGRSSSAESRGHSSRRGSSRSRSRDRRSRHHRDRSESRSRGGSRRHRSRSPGERRHHYDDDDTGSDASSSSHSSSSGSSHHRHSRSRSHSRSQRRESRRSRDRSRDRALRSSDHALERERAARLDKDMKLLTGQQIARARDIERGRERSRLLDTEYDELQDLLESLTLERESVKKTMGFALDHSEAAVDIVGVILKAFKKPNVSAVAMVGYLYVTSDILHNSSAAVKNASLFRTTFQDCLPEIVNHLRRAHKALVGRMSANAMKEKVLNVLTEWESWSLFPPMFLVGLNATFLRKMEEEEEEEAQGVDSTTKDNDADEERLRKTCRQAGILSTGDAKQLRSRLQWLQDFTAPKAPAGAPQRVSSKPVGKSDAAATETSAAQNESEIPATRENPSGLDADSGSVDDDIDGEPIDDAQEEDDGEDLDGEPIDGDDEDLDGQPLDEHVEEENNADGEPLDGSEDLNGELLDESHEEDEEDLDGAPLDDEDLDGEPL